jgi:deferrochelatase/peroxidase EfeB
MGHVSRRHFLAGGLAGTAAAGLGAAVPAGCTDSTAGTSGRDGGDTSTGDGTAGAGAGYLPFRGAHQTGITHPANEQGLLAAFTVTADNRDELRETLRALSSESERLMSGEPYEDRDPAYPPLHTGTVGNPPPPADLSVVASVGRRCSTSATAWPPASRSPWRRCPSSPMTGSTLSARTATCCSR